MPRKGRCHAPGFPVHITTRGVGGRAVFLSDLARQLFLRDLLAIQKQFPFLIHAYCLMTNHIHLLLEAIEAELSDVMELLLGRHAKRLNCELERRGHVFETRYDDTLCADLGHYRNAVPYIHNNPVRAKMAKMAGDWPWSSHRELVGSAPNLFIARDKVLDMLGGVDHYLDLLNRQLPEDAVRLTTGLLGQKLKVDAFEDLVGASPQEFLRELALSSADLTGLRLEDIVGPSKARRESTARNLLIAKARELGIPGREIARFLGRSDSAISEAARNPK